MIIDPQLKLHINDDRSTAYYTLGKPGLRGEAIIATGAGIMHYYLDRAYETGSEIYKIAPRLHKPLGDMSDNEKLAFCIKHGITMEYPALPVEIVRNFYARKNHN